MAGMEAAQASAGRCSAGRQPGQLAPQDWKPTGLGL